MSNGNTICHLAGQAVIVAEGRTIQRCLICGQKLIDSGMVTVILTDRINPQPTWDPGTWVRFDKNKAVKIASVEDGCMPLDNCLPLVEQ